MAALAESDVTLTVLEHTKVNKRRIMFCKMVFGDGSKTYPSGGLALSKGFFGMVRQIDSVAVNAPSTTGIQWFWDRDAEKLRASKQSDYPFLTVEQQNFSSATTHTLGRRPAYILSIDDGTALYDVIPSGETAGANECAVNYTTGVLTFSSAVTPKVTYIPLQGGGLFGSNALVVAEQKTVASAKITLSNRAAAVQYVYNETDNAIVTPIPDDESPADGECTIDINSSGDTVINFNSADNGQTVTVTYLKYSEISTAFQFVDTADITLSSEVINFNTTTGYHGLIIPGFGTRLVAETGAGANSAPRIGGPSQTAANGIVRWQPGFNRFTLAETGTASTINVPLLLVDPAFQTVHNIVELEVTEAPASQTLYATVTGW